MTGSQFIHWFHVQVGTLEPLGLDSSGNQGNVLKMLKKTMVPHDLCHPPLAEETAGQPEETQTHVLEEHPPASDHGKSESTDSVKAGLGDQQYNASLDISFKLDCFLLFHCSIVI